MVFALSGPFLYCRNFLYFRKKKLEISVESCRRQHPNFAVSLLQLPMRCLVLGVLLSFVQAPAAVPPKAPDSTTAKGQKTTKSPKRDKISSAQSPTSVEPTTASPQEQPRTSPKSEDSKEGLRIRELPPVSILKDWSDWGIWTFSGLLVVVGFLQWYVIRIQARLMRVHADHLQNLATAANNNAEAFMVSQRAQLIALLRTGISLFFDGGRPIIPIDIKNNGLTPAYHCMYETWIEVLSVPFQDFTQAADHYKAPFPMTIYPDSPAPTTIQIELGRALTHAESTDFSQGTKSLCFRVRIDYEDAFKKARWCDFAYEFTGERLGALPKYNDSN